MINGAFEDLIAGRHIIVCTGSGGVGKTTLSAAIAVRAAEMGRRTIVCTIDPARRLAQSLGLDELGNEPTVVPARAFRSRKPRGELSAMMLDMKSTFDHMILEVATPDRAKTILANPFYEHISSTLAGTQEYMAMEKLYELHEEGRWELIVIDTPPTRSALDFLDAPRKVTDFLEGRFLRFFLLPTFQAGRGTFKLFNMGAQAFLRAATKITGSELIGDVATFFQLFEGMYGTFKERAKRVRDLLAARRTAFVVVASPQGESLREARYFIDRLAREHIPLGGVVINRSHAIESLPELEPTPEVEDDLFRTVLGLYGDWRNAATREDEAIRSALGDLPMTPVWRVPDLIQDVHDIPSLRSLFGALDGNT